MRSKKHPPSDSKQSSRIQKTHSSFHSGTNISPGMTKFRLERQYNLAFRTKRNKGVTCTGTENSGHFGWNVTVFKTMVQRKRKLRCQHLGLPRGNTKHIKKDRNLDIGRKFQPKFCINP